MSLGDGGVFAYEYIGGFPTTPGSGGGVFAYEYVGGLPATGTSGGVYSYENTVANPNPQIGRVWNGLEWIYTPPYVWTGTAWVEQSAPLPSWKHPFLWQGV